MSFIARILRPRATLRKPQAPSSGAAAEDLAAAWLTRQGLRVLTRNYRVKGGEIDLVCADGDTLVFVEVRLRRNAGFGGAGASITPAKQQRLILAAQHYLQSHGEQACRFDCVLLSDLDENALEWVRDAFAAD
ncbi:MAG TPA: YraN family protein [Rhodocyclaceae bacterium]|jgi:putative endonuclease|nr:YraN family protein [Rhodocyclaceae bacterium]